MLGKNPISSPQITPHKLALSHGAGSVSAQLTVLGRRLPTLSSIPDDSEQKLLEEPSELHFLLFSLNSVGGATRCVYTHIHTNTHKLLESPSGLILKEL